MPIYDKSLCNPEVFSEIMNGLKLAENKLDRRWVLYGTPGKHEKINKDNGT